LADVGYDVGRDNKGNIFIEAIRVRVNSSKIEALKEAKVEGQRRREREEGEERKGFPPSMESDLEG
jgi:hypothetical protein